MPTYEYNGFNLALAGMTDVNISEDGEDHNEPCWGADLSNVKFFRDQEMTIEADIASMPKNVIEAITGFVPIIRCRDCIHRPVPGAVTEKEDFTCPFLNPGDEWYNGSPQDDFFCACGELKN